MQTLDFPTKNHLTRSDQDRLAKLAKSNGQTPEDFVETLIKRAIFAQPAKPTRKGRAA